MKNNFYVELDNKGPSINSSFTKLLPFYSIFRPYQ